MSKKVVLLDYGSGNIRSGERALQRVGADVTVTSDFDQALNADGLLVPGVGAFEACMTGLKAVRGDVLVDRRLTGGRPVLGICVGMQILFARGIEHGVETEGCEQWPGTVERLQPEHDEPVPPADRKQRRADAHALGVDAELFVETRPFADRAIDLVGLTLVGVVKDRNVGFHRADRLGWESILRETSEDGLASDHEELALVRHSRGGAKDVLELVAPHAARRAQ